MILAGLTGSIAMGKSEVSRIFKKHGIPVHDADEAVHQIYARAETADLLRKDFPEAVADGTVSRPILSRLITAKPERLKKLESIVHPLVRQEERRFIEGARHAGAWLALLDIPLLFETGRDKDVDTIIVVSAPALVQRQRALSRIGMTEEKLETILARQMPDAEKRQRANYILENNGSLDELTRQVETLLTDLRKAA